MAYRLSLVSSEEAKGEKALAVSGGNVQLAMEYILANLQQPDAFWATPAPGTGERERDGGGVEVRSNRHRLARE